MDGYSDALSRKLGAVVSDIEATGEDLSMATLSSRGLTIEELRRLLLVEFSSEKEAWGLFVPVDRTACSVCHNPHQILSPPL
jgi:hypothetical protein